MDITGEMKIKLLNELYNQHKDSDPEKAMIVMAIIQHLNKPVAHGGGPRPLVLM